MVWGVPAPDFLGALLVGGGAVLMVAPAAALPLRFLLPWIAFQTLRTDPKPQSGLLFLVR